MSEILIIDDSLVDRTLATRLLQKHGELTIHTAESADEALERIRGGEKPDLIVTDLIMPGTSGLDLVRTVNREFHSIPLILMTAFGNEFIALEALEAGAASYVPKTQLAKWLGDVVDRVLNRAAAEHSQKEAMKSLAKLNCCFALDGDPAAITPLVDHVQQVLIDFDFSTANERLRVGVALEEALHNALCGDDSSFSGADSQGPRGPSGPPPKRRVEFEMNLVRDGGVRFKIRDQVRGQVHGQESAAAAAGSAELAECLGRGEQRSSLLMRALMDHVTLRQDGNEIVLQKGEPRADAWDQQPRPNVSDRLSGATLRDCWPGSFSLDRESKSAASASPEAQEEEEAGDVLEFHELLARLKANFKQPAPATVPWEVTRSLERFRDSLAVYLSIEETRGFSDQVSSAAPHLSPRSQKLQSEHGQLYQAACDLATTGENQDWNRLRQEFSRFLNTFQRHEAAEADLLYEAFWIDIGACD
ncbi:MAG: response regulator [Planctomycetales bacterium]